MTLKRRRGRADKEALPVISKFTSVLEFYYKKFVDLVKKMYPESGQLKFL